MSNSIALSSAIRSNLLALQQTQSLTNQTQSHLATGQKVASAIDDPVSYFQAAALNARATDFQSNKDNIDQGISSLSTALQGITSIQTLVSQLKGLALSAQSASSTQIGTLVSQYNSLRSQISSLATDTSYQGLNLIAGTGSQLNVQFSNLTGSVLNVSSIDATDGVNGLNLAKAYTSNGGFQLGFQGVGSGVVGDGKEIVVTYASTAALASGSYSFAYGTQNLSINVASAGNFAEGGLTTTANFAPGTLYTLVVGNTTLSAGTLATFNVTSGLSGNNAYEATNGNFFISVAANTGFQVSTAGNSNPTISFSLDGLTGSTLADGTYTFNYGGQTIGFTVGSSTTATFSDTTNYVNGQSVSLSVSSGAASGSVAAGVGYNVNNANAGAWYAASLNVVSGYAFAGSTQNIVYAALSAGANNATAEDSNVSAITGTTYLDSNLIGSVNGLVNTLSANLANLQAQAQSLGTNVALLNTRLDFTSNYVNLLQSGAGKLTLADLNQEGANLLALQTRQQLGIQSLSFAGQNEKSVLQLFR